MNKEIPRNPSYEKKQEVEAETDDSRDTDWSCQGGVRETMAQVELNLVTKMEGEKKCFLWIYQEQKEDY